MQQPHHTCEHWGIAFKIVGDRVWVRCQTCPAIARLFPDGAGVFTTNTARMALNGYDTDEHLRMDCQVKGCCEIAVKGDMYCVAHSKAV